MKNNFVSNKNLNLIIDCYNNNKSLGRYGYDDAAAYIGEYVHHADIVTNKQRPLVIEMLQDRLTNDMKNFISISANNPKHLWGSGGLSLKDYVNNS